MMNVRMIKTRLIAATKKVREAILFPSFDIVTCVPMLFPFLKTLLTLNGQIGGF